ERARTARCRRLVFWFECGLCRSSPGRLEELDWIAGWIVEQDLRAAGASHDIVSKSNAGRAEPFDFVSQVVDDEMDAIPPAGLRAPAVGHRPSGRAGWPAQEQPQIAPHHFSERGRRARDQRKSEVVGVKRDRGLDVVDHIANVDRGHRLGPPYERPKLI